MTEQLCKECKGCGRVDHKIYIHKLRRDVTDAFMKCPKCNGTGKSCEKEIK